MQQNSAGLYLHIPFCEHKCIYCDFYSIENLDPVDDFLSALHAEIDLAASQEKFPAFGTVFFGGGTPSLLSPSQVGTILDHLSRSFTFWPDPEITLETNPGTVNREKLRGYRDAGVNRLSFGVQSFFDDDLRFLTRIHSAAQARSVIALAREAGFANTSLDLIFALPHQTLARWEHNLRSAAELEPAHISAYSLIVEPSTPLFRMVRDKIVSPLPLETEAAMYEFTMEFLGARGYEHYEVSNFAKPGFRSRHNSSYWDGSPYLGLGPSAHSFLPPRRWWNSPSISTYITKIRNGQRPVGGEEILTPGQQLDEAIMLGLRSNGVNLSRLKADHGVDLLRSGQEIIGRLVAGRIAVLHDDTLRLTDKGFLLCDSISEELCSLT